MKVTLSRDDLMVMDHFSGRMEVVIRENGSMICRMGRVSLSGRTEVKLKAYGTKDSSRRKNQN